MASQESRALQIRPELQNRVEELARLSRGDLPVDQYLARLLEGILGSVTAQGGAIWFSQGAKFERVCAYRFDEVVAGMNEAQQQSIETAVRDAATHRRPLVVAPTEAGMKEAEGGEQIINGTPFPFFYVPVITSERDKPIVLAVFQAWLPAAFDPRNYQEVVAFLQLAAKEAALVLRVRRWESAAANTEKLQQIIQYLSELSGVIDLDRIGIAVTNRAREIIGCDRVVLFAQGGASKLQVVAVSSVEKVNPRSALVQSQKELASEAMAAKSPTLFRKSSPKTEALGDISDYFFHSHANEALAVPMHAADGVGVGVLLVEAHQDKSLDAAAQKLSIMLAQRATMAVAQARTLGEMPLFKTLQTLAKVRAGWSADRGKRLLIRLGIPAVLLLAAGFFPLPLVIQSDCIIVPPVHAPAVSELSGRVVEVLVREGDKVVAGQVVAKLDDSELRQTLLVMEQEIAKQNSEANRMQARGDEAMRRVVQIEALRAVRQAERIQSEMAKTSIKAPIDGQVLTKELENRLGEIVSAGGRFCEVGDLSQWRVTSRIRESDVALLDLQLQKNKMLPVSFLLYSMPDRTMKAAIRDQRAISQVSTPVLGGNVFSVAAVVEADAALAAQLKAGYTGRSKISLNRRPAIYLMTRKFLNYLRVRWFF